MIKQIFMIQNGQNYFNTWKKRKKFNNKLNI